MQEGIFAVTDIHEAGIEMGQYFLYSPKIDVTHRVLLVSLFAMELDEDLLFEQGNFNPGRGCIDKEFEVARQNVRF